MTTQDWVASKLQLCERAKEPIPPLPNMEPRHVHQRILNEHHERVMAARLEMLADADTSYPQALRALKVAMEELEDIEKLTYGRTSRIPVYARVKDALAKVEKELR
jgi:hypothetical protein